MKKRLKWIMIAAVANVAVLPLALAAPRGASAVSSDSFFYHCCKETVAGDEHCCRFCCMFRFDCLDGTCDEEE